MPETSHEFLIKFFKRYLPFTPTEEQITTFKTDLSLVSPYLMEAALVEIKKGSLGKAPQISSDWRPALFKVYNRKVAEHAQLFGVFHSFETAFRSTVAVSLEQHFQEKRWWRPVYDAMRANQRPRTVRLIGRVPISGNKANTIGEIIQAIDGERFQRDIVGHFGNGFQFVEACDLNHIARLIEDHWAVFAQRFERAAPPPATGVNRLSLDHFKQKFKIIREARNDVYHHKSVAQMTDVVLQAEDLLDYLDYSLKFVHTKIEEASPTKPRFSVDIGQRHRTWSLPADRFLLALTCIIEGHGLDHAVPVPSSERYIFLLERVLIDTQNYVSETLHPTHIATADAAFSKLGIKRASDRMDECARALLIQFRRPN
jgi:hypothetical protein